MQGTPPSVCQVLLLRAVLLPLLMLWRPPLVVLVVLVVSRHPPAS